MSEMRQFQNLSLPIPCAVARQDAAPSRGGRGFGHKEHKEHITDKGGLGTLCSLWPKRDGGRVQGRKSFPTIGKKFPIIGKNGGNFPTIGKIFSNHWKNGIFFPIIGKPAKNFSNRWKTSESGRGRAMRAAGKRLLWGLVVLCGVVAWGGLAYWCVASDRTPPLAAAARQFEPFTPLPAVTNAMRDFESYFRFRGDARKESFVGGYLAPGVQNGSASYKRRYMKDSTSGFFPMPVILDLYFNENDELVAITSSEGYALKLDETKWIPFDKIDDTPEPSPSDIRKEAVDLLKMIMCGPPKKVEVSPVQQDATQAIPAREPTEGNAEGGAP